MRRQLSFAGLDLEPPPAKAKAVKPPRVAKKKRPRRVRKATPAEAAIERKRLAGQALKIYERLKIGTATNDDLAKISRKYTSRISDLRKAGYVVTLISHDHETGLTVYQLGE